MKNIMSRITKTFVALTIAITSISLWPMDSDDSDDSRDCGIHTKLIEYAAYRHMDAVHKLIECTDIDINKQNRAGETPLTLVCFWGFVPCVQTLLKHKDIKINLQNLYGRTALMEACKSNKAACVETLLADSRTNANITNNEGNTALMCAVLNKNLECIQALLTLNDEEKAAIAAEDAYIQEKQHRAAARAYTFDITLQKRTVHSVDEKMCDSLEIPPQAQLRVDVNAGLKRPDRGGAAAQ